MTLIEGEVYFDRAADIQKRADIAKERETLEKLDMNAAPGSGGTSPRIPAERRPAHRDAAEYGDGDNR
jgi:hypothetical protein